MDMQTPLLDHAVELVKAYLNNTVNAVSPEQIPVMLERVHKSLSSMAQRERGAATVASPPRERPKLRVIDGDRL